MNTSTYDHFDPFQVPDVSENPFFSPYYTQGGYLMSAKTPNPSFYPLQDPFSQENINPEDEFEDFQHMNHELANTIPQMDFDAKEEIKELECPNWQRESFQKIEEYELYNFQMDPIPKQEESYCEEPNFRATFQLDFCFLPREKSQKNFTSLAVRNLKSNFGTGLVQFLEFRKDLAEFQKDEKEIVLCKKLLNFLRSRQNSFVSFAGWKDVLKDKEFGRMLRKKAQEFFGKSFARTYVQFGKIREEYKPVYYRKIKCFFEGCKNPELLNPTTFNKY